MGVTMYCRKTKDSIDLGMGGLLRLRRRVSDLVGEPWASHYRTLTDGSVRQDDEWYRQFDIHTAELLQAGKIKLKTLDFLLQSDESGRIRYGACKQLLQLIGDYDDNILYGYAARPDCARFRDFKRLLLQCAEHKCDLVWN